MMDAHEQLVEIKKMLNREYWEDPEDVMVEIESIIDDYFNEYANGPFDDDVMED